MKAPNKIQFSNETQKFKELQNMHPPHLRKSFYSHSKIVNVVSNISKRVKKKLKPFDS
jgi:hypothetical protein